jgi:2-methylaconitate cis-trans-isomerase PrpF
MTTTHHATFPNQNSRHLHARRHQQGRVLPLQDLPASCAGAGQARDALLLRVIGSPDPYGKHIDGMGGATSSTSKCVILSKAAARSRRRLPVRPGVRSTRPSSTGAATAATCPPVPVPFAIMQRADRSGARAANGICVVRIWQANIGKTIIAHVPVTDGQVQETGDFELDGVTFPAAEIVLEFLDPSDEARTAARCSPPAIWSMTSTCPASARFKAT